MGMVKVFKHKEDWCRTSAPNRWDVTCDKCARYVSEYPTRTWVEAMWFAWDHVGTFHETDQGW